MTTAPIPRTDDLLAMLAASLTGPGADDPARLAEVRKLLAFTVQCRRLRRSLRRAARTERRTRPLAGP